MPTTQQLTETLLDQNGAAMSATGQPAPTWTSTNTAVATVNATGLVTRGTTAGTTNVTVTRGTVTSNISAITVPSAAEVLTMPTTAAVDRALWWDAHNGVAAGPAVTLVGAPALVTTVPKHYVMDPPDSEAFSWGAGLDAIFTSADGFAVVVAYGKASTETTLNRHVVHKSDHTGQTTFVMTVDSTGKLLVRVFYAVDGTTEESNISGSVLTTTAAFVVGFSFNPTLAFGSRIILYIGGADQSATDVPATVGAGAAFPAVGTAAFRLGSDSFTNMSVQRLRALGVYSRAINTTEHAELNTHLTNEGWV